MSLIVFAKGVEILWPLLVFILEVSRRSLTAPLVDGSTDTKGVTQETLVCSYKPKAPSFALDIYGNKINILFSEF